MKKIILWAIKIYNRRASDGNKILTRDAIVLKTTKTSTLEVKALKEEHPEMYKNIVAEKLYDMRVAMAHRLKDEGLLAETIEEQDKQVKLTVSVKIYD